MFDDLSGESWLIVAAALILGFGIVRWTVSVFENKSEDISRSSETQSGKDTREGSQDPGPWPESRQGDSTEQGGRMPNVPNTSGGVRGTIEKHWRGDFPLGISYWVFGALVTVAFLAIVAVISGSGLSARYGAKFGATFVLCLYVFMLILTVWQTVGIWRSADKHVGKGGKAFWAGLAKVMVVIGLLRAGADMAHTGLPVMAESINLLTGASSVKPNEIRLLRNGTELELVGGIDEGTTASVRKFLDAAPAIKVIRLNSDGGWLQEAAMLRDLIRERGLITYTSTRCVSACVLAFLGGVERYVGEAGRLGFHSASYGRLELGGELSVDLNRDIRAALKQANVPDSFIERAIATPSKDMWYPSHDELLSAHIVDAVVDSMD